MSDSNPPKTEKGCRKQWRWRICLMLGSFLVSFLLAELLVRAWAHGEQTPTSVQQPVLNPALLPICEPVSGAVPYRLRPKCDLRWGRVNVRTDAQGECRIGADWQASKEDFKIAVIGDSTPFGWQVEYENTYPEVLRRRLEQDTSRRIWLRNFSVPGYNSDAYLHVLTELVLPWQPQVIVLHHDHNDVELTSQETPEHLRPDYGDNVLRSELLKQFIQRTVRHHRKADGKRVMHHQILETRWHAHLDNLRQIHERSAAADIPVIVFVFNAFVERHDDPEKDPVNYDLHAPVAAALRSIGYGHVVDFYPAAQKVMAYRGWDDLKPLWNHRDDAHPNPSGHELIATILHKPVAELINER